MHKFASLSFVVCKFIWDAEGLEIKKLIEVKFNGILIFELNLSHILRGFGYDLTVNSNHKIFLKVLINFYALIKMISVYSFFESWRG